MTRNPIIKIISSLIAALTLSLSFSSVAAAQGGEGYIVAGAGGNPGAGSRPVYEVVGGGEALIGDRFSVGGGAGALATNGYGIFDIFGLARVRLGPVQSSRFVPFVGGGLVYLTDFDEAAYAAQVSGGFDYRFTSRRGLRFEVADLIGADGDFHILTFRVGFVWRSR